MSEFSDLKDKSVAIIQTPIQRGQRVEGGDKQSFQGLWDIIKQYNMFK